jgi:hypothetical protein
MTENTKPTPGSQPEKDAEGVSPSSRPQPFYKHPGTIAAGVLILVAIVLLITWLRGSQTPTQAEATRTVAAPLVLVETDDVTTSVEAPTQTLAPVPTQQQPTPEPTALPRTEVITYTIQEGDTVSSIATKFNLWPETILWANRYELGDDIRNFTPGTTIFILPVDGVYHTWSAGEGLGAVSKYYGVTPEDIINYPANKLSAETIGSYTSPNIAAGTRLVVPGGTLPNYFASDNLLYYAAVEKLNSLPVGNAETHPAPRKEIIAYEVQPLDSIFSIAEQFDLSPETILWTNRYLIGDTPDGIYPGQKLIILPEDGVYHAWLYGEGLNGVSAGYGVTPQDILNEPLNQLDPETIGDLSLPHIKTGTFLYIPGGKGSIPSWVSVVSDPASGDHPNVSYLGAYACNTTAWITGSGVFQLPTNTRLISGYEYNPPVHNGLDYDGETGDPLYAVDHGVVIYAGWSDRGYGNTIVIDHGNGYLSLYGHLMDGGVAVNCGSIVYGGATIGYMGSTGNSTGSHLHFELRYNGSPVNPHDFGL